MKALLRKVFQELDSRIEKENVIRREDGALPVSACEIKILGQMSLLANDKVSAILSLAQTADMDAVMTRNTFAKKELKETLKQYGLEYDEDSEKVWLPKNSKFLLLFELKNVVVKIIDPESALVSKAVKAPAKNKILIREAIASGEFPELARRITKEGGKLEYFAEN